MSDFSVLTCSRCGGRILGDGYTEARHCENADYDDYYDCEPDAPVVLCREYEE